MIDLTASSPDVDVDLTVHNGVHCGGVESCEWTNCVEYAGGDHFLQALLVRLGGKLDYAAAAPMFPLAWCDASRWATAFKHAHAALSTLSNSVRSLCEQVAQLRLISTSVQTWFLDVASWLQVVVGSVVRDVWVQPDDHQSRCVAHRRYPVNQIWSVIPR